MKQLKSILLVTTLTLSANVSAELFYTAVAQNLPDSDLISIDSDTCILTTVGTIGHTATGLAIDPNGELFGTDPNNGQLVSINTTTGVGTAVGTLEDSNQVAHDKIPDVAFHGSILYGWTETSDDLVQINPLDAVVTVTPSNEGTAGTGLAIDSTGIIYLAPGDGSLYTVDSTTGVTTEVAAITGIDALGDTNALTFDDNDVLWANAKNDTPTGINRGGDLVPGALVRINHITGAAEVVCNNFPTGTDSLVFYGESTDLIFKDGFE